MRFTRFTRFTGIFTFWENVEIIRFFINLPLMNRFAIWTRWQQPAKPLQFLHQLRLIHSDNKLFIEYRCRYPKFLSIPFYPNIPVSQQITDSLGITIEEVINPIAKLIGNQ